MVEKISRKMLAVLLILPVLFIGFISAYVLSNLFDWKIEVLNPPDQTYGIPLILLYPPQNYSVHFTYGVIYVSLTLSYTGALVERQPITAEAIGTIFADNTDGIDGVNIGFEGAFPYPWNVSDILLGLPYEGVSLRATVPNQPPTGFDMGVMLTGAPVTISWFTQGDFHPILTIRFNNGSSPIVQPYENYQIHVSSSDVLLQERYNRIDTALSVALFAFTLIGSADLIIKVWNWRKDSLRRYYNCDD